MQPEMTMSQYDMYSALLSRRLAIATVICLAALAVAYLISRRNSELRRQRTAEAQRRTACERWQRAYCEEKILHRAEMGRAEQRNAEDMAAMRETVRSLEEELAEKDGAIEALKRELDRQKELLTVSERLRLGGERA